MFLISSDIIKNFLRGPYLGPLLFKLGDVLKRRLFLFSTAAIALWANPLIAHSPWGQYQVYRQKHLLILSSRDDDISYPFSKELVSCLDQVLPIAKARPARAINLARAFDLLRTDQFQFALFNRTNIDKMRTASDDFSGKRPVELSTMIGFGDMQFVVRKDFPADLVATVTHNIIKCRKNFSIPMNVTKQALKDPHLHQGAKEALNEFLTDG